MIALLMSHGAFVTAVSLPLAVIDTIQGTALWSRVREETTAMFDPTTDVTDVDDLLLTDYDLSLIDGAIDDWPTTDPTEEIWDWPTVAFNDGLGFDHPATDTELPF